MYASADTIFVFGHGKDGIVLGKKTDVVYFRSYLSAALDHVSAGLKAGQSKEAKLTEQQDRRDQVAHNERRLVGGNESRNGSEPYRRERHGGDKERAGSQHGRQRKVHLSTIGAVARNKRGSSLCINCLLRLQRIRPAYSLLL